MARRPAPPSSSPGSGSTPRDAGAPTSPRRTSSPRTNAARTVDVREWVSGIRLSGFMVIMLSLVVLGAWVLVPTLGTYLDQRQKIAALEQAIEVGEDRIAALEQERDRWSDPAFITTQARERLYYYQPGQILYLVQDDLDPAALPKDPDPVSDEVQEKESDWMPQLLRSLTAAGLAQPVTAAPAG